MTHAAADWIEWIAGQGREADLGPLGHSRLGMKASFDSCPDRIEPDDVKLSVAWTLPRALQKGVALKGKSLVRERISPDTKEPTPITFRRMLPNAKLAPEINRYEPGEPACIIGKWLKYNPDQADEGIFFIDSTGAEHRV